MEKIVGISDTCLFILESDAKLEIQSDLQNLLALQSMFLSKETLCLAGKTKQQQQQKLLNVLAPT